MNTIKSATRSLIISNAKELFLLKSINEVTIYDIAKKAGIGEATVYRYFKNKLNLVIETAVEMSKDVYEDYFKFSENEKGYDIIYKFYNSFYLIFKYHMEFFSFINEFDSFLVSSDSYDSIDYETSILQFKNVYDKAYEKGIYDGTIKAQEDPDTFYYATTHSLLSLCKKLAVRKDILENDKLVSKEEELKMMVNIILNQIKM